MLDSKYALLKGKINKASRSHMLAVVGVIVVAAFSSFCSDTTPMDVVFMVDGSYVIPSTVFREEVAFAYQVLIL